MKRLTKNTYDCRHCNRPRIRWNDILIQVTDEDGNIAYGTDIDIVAEHLGCSKYAVRKAIKDGTRIEGSRIRLVDSVTFRPVETRG